MYAQQHAFPHDIFAIQMKIALADDFTIDLIFVATVVVFVCMGVLAQNWVRRNHFELFYWSHHVALAFFVAALWHATGLWYYLLPGLTLWFVDRAIRFERGCARVADRLWGVRAWGLLGGWCSSWPVPVRRRSCGRPDAQSAGRARRAS